ncbi:enoyl-CoA hydratase/isomerase family protein [Chelativorans sp. Marseille-P2723]|uniref:enoyl-CoA hydratase/isomerase family protein n=1 Tax=Chelativorans sp. Marseille-P2723 TaxID=2709133 RepID=UPI00156E31F1|nr:enoyl-CoA hydratase/isomerase family protein [Chelativorans sp. Marseille-P2723]
MSDDVIELRVDERVAHVIFRRPQVLNAINERFCQQLSGIFDTLEKNSEISVAILSGGQARAFSAGADLTFMRTLSGPSLRRFIEMTWLVFNRIARSHIVSIAAMHGYALGGGAELALACDMRIADEDTQIGFPEMTLGSVPGSGAVQRLPLLIGRARAIELILGGQKVRGREAESIGLINSCVPSGRSVPVAEEWGSRFASRPPEALRFMKAALSVGPDGNVGPALHGLISSICQSADGYRSNTHSFSRKSENR